MDIAKKLPADGPAFVITAETDADVPAREALLDRAMGPKRKTKSSEKLRRGRRPSEGLAFVARDRTGAVVGTVRLWDVALGGGERKALLLGPLAVEPSLKGAGLGTALMHHAIAEAARLYHKAILLVGDAPYYERFGFSAEKTGALAMPGPYERDRFLALELAPGALDGAEGLLRPIGRRARKMAAWWPEAERRGRRPCLPAGTVRISRSTGRAPWRPTCRPRSSTCLS